MHACNIIFLFQNPEYPFFFFNTLRDSVSQHNPSQHCADFQQILLQRNDVLHFRMNPFNCPSSPFADVFQTLSPLPLFAFVCFFYFFKCQTYLTAFLCVAEPEDYIYLLEVIFEKKFDSFHFSLLQEEKRKKKKDVSIFFKNGE